jgi:hypothetical protein
MGTIQTNISDLDLGHKGVITGEAGPGTRQSVLDKLRKSDTDLRLAIETYDDDFDVHDHSGANGGSQLGSVLSDDTRADSFQDGAFTGAKLAVSSVTGAKTAVAAIDSSKVVALTMDKTRIGNASRRKFSNITAGSSQAWNHGLGRVPFCELEGDDASGADPGAVAAINLSASSTQIVLYNNGLFSTATCYVVYR